MKQTLTDTRETIGELSAADMQDDYLDRFNEGLIDLDTLRAKFAEISAEAAIQSTFE
jgi:hypothetical protein